MKDSITPFGFSSFFRLREKMNNSLIQEIKYPKLSIWRSDSFLLLLSTLLLTCEYLVTFFYYFKEQYTMQPYEIPFLTIFCIVSFGMIFLEESKINISQKSREVLLISFKIIYTFFSSFLYITLHSEVISLDQAKEDVGPLRLIDQTIIFTFIFTLYLNSRSYSSFWLGLISMTIIITTSFVFNRISNFTAGESITTAIFAVFFSLIIALNILKSSFKQKEKFSVALTQYIIQDLLQNVPVGVVLFNNLGKILFFNNESRGIFSTETSPQSNFELEFRKKLMKNRLRLIPNKETVHGIQLKHFEKYSSSGLGKQDELLLEGFTFEECLSKFVQRSLNDENHPRMLYNLELDPYPGDGRSNKMEEATASPFRTFKQIPRKLFEVSFVKIVANSEVPFILTTFKDISQAVSIHEYNQKTELKNQILSSFSHELKTPLNGSLTLIESAARDKDLSQDFKEKFLFQPLKSLKLLSFLINDIIDYLKIDTNQLNFQFEKFKLRDLLDEVVDLSTSKIQCKNISFIQKFDAALSDEFCTDSLRLKCILINLINNCIKHTLKGEVVLSTKASENDIIFEISDNRFRSFNFKRRQPYFTKINQNSSGDHITESTGEVSNSILNFYPASSSYCYNPSAYSRKTMNHKSHSTKLDNGNPHSASHPSNLTDSLDPPHQSNYDLYIALNQDEIIAEENGMSEIYVETSDIEEENELGLYVSRQLAQLLGPRNCSGIKIFIKKDTGVLYRFKISNLQLNLMDSPNIKMQSSLQINFVNESEKEIHVQNNSPPIHMSHFNPNNQSSHQQNFKSLQDQEESVLQHISEGEILHENQMLYQRNILRIETTESSQPLKCDCEDVLLVDDDPFNLFSLEAILNKKGYKVLKALNGALAVETVIDYYHPRRCSNCPGLLFIFMDLNMPVMGGIEATKILKENMSQGRIPEIPIIACTANDTQKDIKECEKVGMNGFLSKPVSLSKLEDILEKQLLQF